jgi:hypothetical protein
MILKNLVSFDVGVFGVFSVLRAGKSMCSLTQLVMVPFVRKHSKEFVLTRLVRRPTPSPPWLSRLVYPGIQRQGREANHPPVCGTYRVELVYSHSVPRDSFVLFVAVSSCAVYIHRFDCARYITVGGKMMMITELGRIREEAVIEGTNRCVCV